MCGWISVAALPPLHLFPLLFVSISLLLFLIQKSATPKQAFLRGYCFGFAFFAFGLLWIGNAVLIDRTFLMMLYPIIFIACGAFFGLFAAIPAWLSFRFQKPVSVYLSFCALSVVFEWIRSFFLTGFPWNLWGSVFAFQTALLQFAAYGGTYLLSLLALLICGAPFLWLARPDKKSAAAAGAVSVVLLGFMFAAGLLRLNSEKHAPSSTIVRFVQPSIPQTLKWNAASLEQNLDAYIALSKQKPLRGVSAVLWGETASPFPLDMDEAHNYKARQAVPENGYLITGQIRYRFQDGRTQASNSVMVFDDRGSPVAYYDKAHLVPFGEYVPLRRWLPNWLRPLANTVGTFAAGSGPQKISLSGLPDFGAAICYEAIFPHRIINQKDRPQWIINPTNDGWYGVSFGPYQHFTAARLRAVEEGVTVARIANNGISALISPYGTVLGKLNLNETGALDIPLPTQISFPTAYSKYGNLSVLIICTFLLFTAFILHPNPRK